MFSILKNSLKKGAALHTNIPIGVKVLCIPCSSNSFSTTSDTSSGPKKIKRGKTPIGKLDQEIPEPGKTEDQDIPDPYAPFPEGKNPLTGEMGGPRGPEPTRYGDWERKGRVSDF